eukprot:11624924-Ditylum_brightwellii.AAC.1
MVHPCNCVKTDGTVLFHGVGNSDNSADKYLTHLSQVVDCHLSERSDQNKHVVGDKDDGVDDSVDNSVDDSVDNTVDNSVDDSVDDSDNNANKYLTHLSHAVDCCLMERSKQNEHAVGNKDNGVDNSVDDSVDGADKHLTHLSQACNRHRHTSRIKK